MLFLTFYISTYFVIFESELWESKLWEELKKTKNFWVWVCVQHWVTGCRLQAGFNGRADLWFWRLGERGQRCQRSGETGSLWERGWSGRLGLWEIRAVITQCLRSNEPHCLFILSPLMHPIPTPSLIWDNTGLTVPRARAQEREMTVQCIPMRPCQALAKSSLERDALLWPFTGFTAILKQTQITLPLAGPWIGIPFVVSPEPRFYVHMHRYVCEVTLSPPPLPTNIEKASLQVQFWERFCI